MKKAHQPINHISKTIQEFNRECEEEKLKGNSNLQKKYEKRIQNYGIDMNSKIGEGTFSKVYKGKDLQQGTQVAVKIVQLKKIQEMGIEQLFWGELNIIKRLKHPNIVSCYEYFRTTNNCYTIYELCQNGDLSKRIRKGHLGDRDDINQANLIIKDIFQGLLYLESMSIVHRDIKAANILLSKGKAKIGDFGFATHCKREFKDVSIGSPAYMAPQGLVNNIYGPKTDVWAFGMLIYEIVHGQTPFYNCESEAELKQRVQIPVNWDQLKGSLSSPLKRLILKCLKVDFSQRPTFSQLLNDQYIQKIYHEGNTYRQHAKSNYTKQTTDSEEITSRSPISKVRERKSVNPFENRFVTENIISAENNEKSQKYAAVKTQANEDDDEKEKINPGLVTSINMLEPFPEAQQMQEIKDELVKKESDQRSQENVLKEITVEKYLLTEDQYSKQILESYLHVVTIFRETVTLLKNIPERNSPLCFESFISQMLLQVYSKAKYQGYSEMLQKLRILIDPNDKIHKQSIQLPTSLKQTYQQIDEQLFSLIKLVETTIDRQDIEGNNDEHSQNQRILLIYTGNMLIISLQFIYNASDIASTNQWIINSQGKLQQSQQFYIWLYELQLKRMQLTQH